MSPKRFIWKVWKITQPPISWWRFVDLWVDAAGRLNCIAIMVRIFMGRIGSFRSFRTMNLNSTLQVTLASDGIQWYFIPPVAPHFGGLWEAGMESLKFHLLRVIGSRMQGWICDAALSDRICLNSRPIAALNDDPSDLSTLMPGHFLIGRVFQYPKTPYPGSMRIGCPDGSSYKPCRSRFGARD